MKHIRSRVNGPKLKAMIINSETVQSKKMPDVAQVVFHFLAQQFSKRSDFKRLDCTHLNV